MDTGRDAVRTPAHQKKGEGERAAHDAAWAWLDKSGLLDGVEAKQVELEVADLVVGAFILYDLMGPEGDVRTWQRPYLRVGERFVFETDGKDKQTPWGVLLREAVRAVRQHKATR